MNTGKHGTPHDVLTSPASVVLRHKLIYLRLRAKEMVIITTVLVHSNVALEALYSFYHLCQTMFKNKILKVFCHVKMRQNITAFISYDKLWIFWIILVTSYK